MASSPLIGNLRTASSIFSQSGSMSLRSDDGFHNSNIIILRNSAGGFRKGSNNNGNNGGGGKLRVKATGGGGMGRVAKYKGTQMREKQLSEMIEKKVMEAEEVCQGDETSDECRVAWDEVEEVSQAKADLRLKLENQLDPLEFYCQDNPETDECRVYED